MTKGKTSSSRKRKKRSLFSLMAFALLLLNAVLGINLNIKLSDRQDN